MSLKVSVFEKDLACMLATYFTSLVPHGAGIYYFNYSFGELNNHTNAK